MRHPVSRRRLLTSGAAASFLVASAPVSYAMPRRGGLLRVGVTGKPGNWDTRKGLGTFGLVAGIGTIFEGLTEIASDGTLRGELAETWQAHEGGRVWDISLRKGVSFHDGRRFCSEDVVASLNLHQGSGSPAAWIADQISEITPTGALSVQVTLVSPNPDFPLQLADPHLVIYPAHDLSGAMENGIGTGLYRAGRVGPGDRLTAWRVDDHWKGEAWGSFTEVEIVSMPDPLERAQAVKSEQVHAAEGDPDSGFDLFLGNPGLPVWHSAKVERPSRIGTNWPMDNGRIAERWWRV